MQSRRNFRPATFAGEKCETVSRACTMSKGEARGGKSGDSGCCTLPQADRIPEAVKFCYDSERLVNYKFCAGSFLSTRFASVRRQSSPKQFAAPDKRQWGAFCEATFPEVRGEKRRSQSGRKAGYGMGKRCDGIEYVSAGKLWTYILKRGTFFEDTFFSWKFDRLMQVFRDFCL